MALKYFETATAYTAANPKDSDICFVKDEGAVYTHGEKFGGGGNETYVETTWSQLRTLRNNSELIPGTTYRITNYTLRVQSSFSNDPRSGNHPFDILVTALTSNRLSENASAILHNGDTYFANCDLSAWKLKYCLDNDTNRFKWAYYDGRGVIYELEDEFGNCAPYDFKNMLLPRTTTWFNNHSQWCTDVLGSTPTSNQYYYTFTLIQNNEITDASIVNTLLLGNKISHLFENTSKEQLPTNIIVMKSSTEYVNNNLFEGWCDGNTLGPNCRTNVFINSSNNTLGISCNDNEFRFSSINSIATNSTHNVFISANQNDFSAARLLYCYFGSDCNYNSCTCQLHNAIFETGVQYTAISGYNPVEDLTIKPNQYLTLNYNNSASSCEGVTIHKYVSTSTSRKTMTISNAHLNCENDQYASGINFSTFYSIQAGYKFHTFSYDSSSAKTLTLSISGSSSVESVGSEYHIILNGCTVDGAKLKIPSTILNCPVYVDGLSAANYTFTLDLNKNNWESGKEYTEINLIKSKVDSTNYRWLVKTDGDWDKTPV